MTEFARIFNGGMLPVGKIPRLPVGKFLDAIVSRTSTGERIACLSAVPLTGKKALSLVAVLCQKDSGSLSVGISQETGDFPSITQRCEQAHLFEREIAEQWGITPLGHPWLKPVRFQPPRATKAAPPPTCGVTNYYRVEGEEIHEVAVGPVHAGIIEPGHFRFQCHGETVYHLEISLGYQHRGVERAMIGGPDGRSIHYVETLAGDTTIGHTMAHCLAMEALGAAKVSPRAQVIRGIAEELERVANHIGDLGALAGDVGFLPTQSYCGRIRGDVLNMTARICGNRFGRGLIRPGGVTFDIDSAMAQQLVASLDAVLRDTESAVNLLWNTPSVMARFETTGTVSLEICRTIGLVGVAARACGDETDVRSDLPYGIYRYSHLPISTCASGDVFARAHVRWQEIQRSLAFVREQLQSLPEGEICAITADPRPGAIALGLIEGWRGEICHLAITDSAGKFVAYKVVDPSFHNWFGLACALRNQQISDFPLCNKSFNLSYCGYDL